MVGREASEPSPLGSRGFVFSAAGVGLLVVAAVFLVVATIAGHHAPSTHPSSCGRSRRRAGAGRAGVSEPGGAVG
jgi:hypothetical protein